MNSSTFGFVLILRAVSGDLSSVELTAHDRLRNQLPKFSAFSLAYFQNSFRSFKIRSVRRTLCANCL